MNDYIGNIYKKEEQEIQPAQPEPRHCKNCGALLEEDAIFCIYCGTKNN